MRVLQGIGGSGRGGAELQFTRLALALGRAGLIQRLLVRRDAEGKVSGLTVGCWLARKVEYVRAA